MACASPVVLHPPLASAFWKPRRSLLLAFARHRASTGSPRPNAAEWHLMASLDFFPAALIFAAAQRTAALSELAGCRARTAGGLARIRDLRLWVLHDARRDPGGRDGGWTDGPARCGAG